MVKQSNEQRQRDRAQREQELNRTFAQCFSSPAGQSVIQFLRQQTIETVSGPAVEPNSLMHLEGQRFLVGMIEQRIAAGHRKASDE